MTPPQPEQKENIEIEERLIYVRNLKALIADLLYQNQSFCIHCSEDRIYCPTCVLPLIKRKLELVFN
jgi:hypothetical protein